MEVPRDRLDLKDDPALCRPPSVDQAWQCAELGSYTGSSPTLIWTSSSTAGSWWRVHRRVPPADGAAIRLPAPLTAGQVIRARQTLTGNTSNWSAPVTVRDHTLDYPAGLPGRQINPAPVYRCGRRTGVSNLLLGSDVSIIADGVEVGRISGAKTQQGVDHRAVIRAGPVWRSPSRRCARTSARLPPPKSRSRRPRPFPCLGSCRPTRAANRSRSRT